MEDLSQHNERHLRIVEAVETFDEALARVVQIIEREEFTIPMVEINPCWGDGEELHYYVVVTATIEKGSS